MSERTLVLVKPDGVSRGLVGEVIARIERKGLTLAALELRTVPRDLAGGTDPVDKAAPGSIRGDFALETQSNLVHGSDSVDSAKREIALWFPEL